MFKKLFFFVFIVSGCAATYLSAQAIKPDSLVLHLPFDGNTLDVSGNNYNGTGFNTSFATDANGQPGKAILFNGSSSYVTIPNVTQLDGVLTDFTILVRMWVETAAPLPDVQAPFSTAYGFLTWHRNTGDSGMAYLQSKLRAAVGAANQSGEASIGYIMDWCTGNVGTASGYNRPQSKMVGKWITFSLRYHRGTMEAYFNCEKLNYWPNIYPTVSDLCGTDPMQITLGLVPQAAFQYGYRYFNGKIDDLRIYKRAVTDAEIQAYTDSTCIILPEPTLRISVLTPDPCSPEKVIIKDASILNGDSLISKKWSINNDSSTLDSINYQFAQAGGHRIQLQYITKSGTYTKDTVVNIDQLGRIHFLAAEKPQVSICEGSSVKLSVGGGSSYQWQPCTYLDNCNAAEVIAKPEKSQQYKIVGSNFTGCADSVYIQLTVILDTANIWLPTAFTPNNDGLNDSFGILSFSPLAQSKLQVYNRWGQLIFNSSQSSLRWNGGFNGTPQPTGQYPWKAQYYIGEGCPEKRISGVVTLLR